MKRNSNKENHYLTVGSISNHMDGVMQLTNILRKMCESDATLLRKCQAFLLFLILYHHLKNVILCLQNSFSERPYENSVFFFNILPMLYIQNVNKEDVVFIIFNFWWSLTE